MDHSKIGLLEKVWRYTENLLTTDDFESDQVKGYFPYHSQQPIIDNWTDRDTRTSKTENHQITTITLKKMTPMATITHIATTITRPSSFNKDKPVAVHVSMNPSYREVNTLSDIDDFNIPRLHLHNKDDHHHPATSRCPSRRVQWQPKYWIHIPTVTKIHPQSIWYQIEKKSSKDSSAPSNTIVDNKINGGKTEINLGLKSNEVNESFI